MFVKFHDFDMLLDTKQNVLDQVEANDHVLYNNSDELIPKSEIMSQQNGIQSASYETETYKDMVTFMKSYKWGLVNYWYWN